MTIQDHGGLRVPDFMPTFDIEGGFVTLTCKQGHRLSISASIERLIDMLDAMEPDPDLEDSADDEPLLGWPNASQGPSIPMSDDLEGDWADYEPTLGATENHPQASGHGRSKDGAQSGWTTGIAVVADGENEPSLGAPERHPASFETAFAGRVMPRSGFLTRDRSRSQEDWAAGDTSGEDREDDDEREPDQDDEYSTGWADEGSQAVLRSDHEIEPELGWPEQVNQVERSVVNGEWLAIDGEPDLGFVGIATGWRCGEDILDREQDSLGDDEREHDHAEHGIVELCEDDFVQPYIGSFGGHAIAEALLAKAGTRRVADLTYVETSHVMPNGTIMRNFVASDDSKVIH